MYVLLKVIVVRRMVDSLYPSVGLCQHLNKTLCRSCLFTLASHLAKTFSLTITHFPTVLHHTMSLQGKVIVITGAASGIGLATARHFASKGAKLSLADIQEKPLKDLEAELTQSGAEVMTQVVDVTKRAEVDRWTAATIERFGKLDGAANVAGVYGKGPTPFEATTDEEWDFIFGINVFGVRNCLQAQIPRMKDGASIANVASIAGLRGVPNSSVYGASKHAVVGISKTLAKELAPRNIRVNCICPYVSLNTLCKV